MPRVHGILGLLLAFGCTASPPPTPSTPARAQPVVPAPTPKPAETPTEPTTAVDFPPPAMPPPAPELDGDRWRCARDEDCVQTCGLGAVSAAWLSENRDADTCDDGCGWKSGQQACRDGGCVTLEADGKTVDTSCTRVTKPLFEP